MAIPLTEKLVGFILRPVGTFRDARDETVVDAGIYFLVLLVINALITAVLSVLGFSAVESVESTFGIGATTGALDFVGSLVAAFIGGIVVLIVLSVFLHVGARFAGGRGDFADSLKSSVYSLTPSMLLGWLVIIPVIGWILGLVFFIWSVVLLVLGVRELHELDTGRAIIAVVIAIGIILLILVILAVVIGVALFALFGIFSSSGGPLPVVTVVST
ncbi:MAG: YIP1 family protein [Methanospirillum sp.]|nr:YIP1 family protein [Methanospirillum sp.]